MENIKAKDERNYNSRKIFIAARMHFKLEKNFGFILSATPECSHNNANKMLLFILGYDKTTQKLSRGNKNDSCEDGMITSFTSSQQTQVS